MKQKKINSDPAVAGKLNAAQLEGEVKRLTEPLLGRTVNTLVLGPKTVVLTPQARAKLVKPVTGEVPILGEKLKLDIMALKQRATKGEEDAARVLYDIVKFGVLALDSVSDLDAIKSLAQHKSMWPVMGSADDSVVNLNNETFQRIGLARKIQTRPISHLLRQDSAELYWLVSIWTEINRMRDFGAALANETRVDLFGKAEPVWPCRIGSQEAYLRAEVILESEKLPTLGTDEVSQKAWWALVEKIFEIATNNAWERVPELRTTYEGRARKLSDKPADLRAYIRTNMKKNLRIKFFTRIAPLPT